MKQVCLLSYLQVNERLFLVAGVLSGAVAAITNICDRCHHELVNRLLNFCFSDDIYVPIVTTTILLYPELYSPSCVNLHQ